MNGLLQDFRYALRMLRKSPGFTALAVITLALGIGANTTMYSSVNALVLRPFDLPDLDRVVSIYEAIPSQGATQVRAAPANFRDWSEQSTSFEQLAALRSWGANLTGDGLAERVEGYRVTPEFFRLLAIAPQQGRNLGSVDFQNGTAPVVVVSHRFWQKHLGGAPAVVDKILLLNGQKYTVVGVAGRGVDYPAGADIWTPLDLSSAAGMDRSMHDLIVLGRLKKGTSISGAVAGLQGIAARLARQYPDTNGGHEVRVVNLVEDSTQGTRQFVLVLMGASVFVLLLACVNVANLQLARISSRQKEMAVRMGLGAGRWHLIRQLLVESTLLAMAGAGGGILLAIWGMALTRRSLPPFIIEHVPGLKHQEVDAHVLWFTLGVAVLTGILAGLAPALRFSRAELGDTLKENSRAASASPKAGRLRAVLVTTEVALALVLLVGAGLMVKGFKNLAQSEMGFDRAHVLGFRVALPEERYQTKDQILNYYDRALRQIESLPGVRSVACATTLPGNWSANWIVYQAEGRPPAAPGEMPSTMAQVVTPDFFATLRVPLLKGRFLSAEDGRDAPPVAVISATLARNAWPGMDPIGKHLTLGPKDSPEQERRVVGVVGDVRFSPFQPSPDPATYTPLAQSAPASTAFVVRTDGDPLALATLATAQIRNIDPDTPAYDVRSVEQILSDNVSGVEFSAHMMTIFGAIALTLAAAGIFAVMAYVVAQRTHEIGVRMALGARRVDVLRLVIRSALGMAGIGLAIGMCVAWLLTRAVSNALLGVVRIDPPLFVLLTLILAAIATLAAYIPARSATKVDPMQALRYE